MSLQLSFHAYPLRLHHVFTVSGCSRSETPDVQVQIKYQDKVGYGEASMPPYLGESIQSVLAFLNKVDLTPFSTPFQLEEILQYVDTVAPGNTAAKASIDIALHDLVGKLLNQSWYQIWNLDKNTMPPTTFTIGIDTPEIVRQKTLEVLDKYQILKVKVGVPGDKELIQTIRSVTAVPLAVDANQGWQSPQEALEMIDWLAKQGVVMVEQPLLKTDLEGSAWLTARSPIPIFADESVQRLSDVSKLKGVFHGINIKLMKCTGMHEAWQMANLAKSMDLKVMIGCMTESSCAIAAAAQLAPMADFVDLDGNLLIDNDCFVGHQLKNGVLQLNDLPGIGVVPKF